MTQSSQRRNGSFAPKPVIHPTTIKRPWSGPSADRPALQVADALRYDVNSQANWHFCDISTQLTYPERADC